MKVGSVMSSCNSAVLWFFFTSLGLLYRYCNFIDFGPIPSQASPFIQRIWIYLYLFLYVNLPLRFFLSFKLPFCVAKPTIGYLHEGNKHCPASQVAVVVNADVRCVGSIPGLGRSPGGGHGNPLQCSCLENPMDRRAWLATVQELDMSKVT